MNPEQTVSSAGVERILKVQEVILKAMAGSLKWWEAAEIIVSDRTMRRWRERYQEHGYDRLYDRRKGRPSPKRVALQTAETILREKKLQLTALEADLSAKQKRLASPRPPLVCSRAGHDLFSAGERSHVHVCEWAAGNLQ